MISFLIGTLVGAFFGALAVAIVSINNGDDEWKH